ncbi:acyl-CoA thioesterase [Nocardioides aromaticivorans]|nr:acyl-CoA thioesterase domain-containing protein [Nocardioides aromaticivorans]
MTDAKSAEVVDDVIDTIRLTSLDGAGGLRFGGRTTTLSLPFVFGGQLLAQALWAGYQCTPANHRVQALHAHFVEAGDPRRPLTYTVDPVRRGHGSSVLRVTATQARDGSDGERVILIASLNLGGDRSGLDHHTPPVSAFGIDPARLPALRSWLEHHRDLLPEWWQGPLAFDLRYPEEPPHVLSPGAAPRVGQQLWMTTHAVVPDEPRLHDCLLAFASDLTLLDAVMLRHARSWYDGGAWAASLDHSIWFHRRARVDDWMLYEQASPSAHGGRGLASGEIYGPGGVHVATVAQLGVFSIDGHRSMPGAAVPRD